MLFEFNKILKKKYNLYKKTKPNKMQNIDFDEFKKIGIEQIKKIFHNYFTGININYINNILNDKTNHILLSCISNNFEISNITSILIFHKTKLKNITKYYIWLIGTHTNVRNLGYGSIIINEFIEFIKSKSLNQKNNQKQILLLKSLDTSLKFYLDLGFEQAVLSENKLFFKYETLEEIKNNKNFILQYII